MTALARHAATRLPARTLHAHDLPSQTGFMVFEAPLADLRQQRGPRGADRRGELGPVGRPRRQAAHGRWGSGRWDQGGGIWLSFFSHAGDVDDRAATSCSMPGVKAAIRSNGAWTLTANRPLTSALMSSIGDQRE